MGRYPHRTARNSPESLSGIETILTEALITVYELGIPLNAYQGVKLDAPERAWEPSPYVGKSPESRYGNQPARLALAGYNKEFEINALAQN
ncbi:hypothetical protein [Coleofasciculus sp. A1-SPW-01]|uniref:hypothetical protein n=1 Tax=Coleofasciculus sp. A1-SPW-01 TaxID=3070819 RepID=UPI004063CF6B